LCHGGDGRRENPVIERQRREAQLKAKAFKYEVEFQQARSKYLSERESHYRSLREDVLFTLWGRREELALEQDEIELLRRIIREIKGITQTKTTTIHVCASCGMVGDNCTCIEHQ
tara:strand:+ start:258 stop:602 length:345 start_codon:yes stop_codon:yes gene_type:complete